MNVYLDSLLPAGNPDHSLGTVLRRWLGMGWQSPAVQLAPGVHGPLHGNLLF